MAVIDRRVGLPLSKWRWHGVDFFSGLMGVLVLQVNVWVEEHIASPPWGIASNTRAKRVVGRGELWLLAPASIIFMVDPKNYLI